MIAESFFKKSSGDSLRNFNALELLIRSLITRGSGKDSVLTFNLYSKEENGAGD